MAVPIYKRGDKYYPIRFDHLDLLSNFAIPVICKSQKTRDQLVKKCADRIEIRPIVGGDITEQHFFRKYMTEFNSLADYSNARLIHEQGLYFGNNPELTKSEKRLIIRVFTGG